MSNSYFQFKQFTVKQEKCAMKVCTDACLFGAYISANEKALSNKKSKILDIGAGTGLLSLMIAQKVEGDIDAVEIDEKAFEQARENFEDSPWKARLTAIHANAASFPFKKKYDIIVSNPPFFENSLKSDDHLKNIAKHTTTLNYAVLASLVSDNLITWGRFYILLPFQQFQSFEKIAMTNQLYDVLKLPVRQNEEANFFRTIGVFSKIKTVGVAERAITIKACNNEYTQTFVELLRDYYLYL